MDRRCGRGVVAGLSGRIRLVQVVAAIMGNTEEEVVTTVWNPS